MVAGRNLDRLSRRTAQRLLRDSSFGGWKEKIIPQRPRGLCIALVAGRTLCGLCASGLFFAGCGVLSPDGAKVGRQFGDTGRRRGCVLHWLSVGEESGAVETR